MSINVKLPNFKSVELDVGSLPSDLAVEIQPYVNSGSLPLDLLLKVCTHTHTYQ